VSAAAAPLLCIKESKQDVSFVAPLALRLTTCKLRLFHQPPLPYPFYVLLRLTPLDVWPPPWPPRFLPYLDAFADRQAIAADYSAALRPVVQPAVAQERLASLSNYAKVFHPNFIKPGQDVGAAFAGLMGDKSGGKFFFRSTSRKDEVELVWAFQPGIVRRQPRQLP